jgi:hypothetical protein
MEGVRSANQFQDQSIGDDIIFISSFSISSLSATSHGNREKAFLHIVFI